MLKLNKLNRLGAYTSASLVTGLMAAKDAHANATGFNAIGTNITAGITELPGLLTALSYMMGSIFAVLGVLKIKDHVENPTQTPLKEGAIRLASGGALFAIPVVTEAMQTLIAPDAAQPLTINSLQGVDKFNAVN